MSTRTTSQPSDNLAPLATSQRLLRACGLLAEDTAPAVWCGKASWAVLDTDFGTGLNFLLAWHAWQQDRARPARLFYTALVSAVPSLQGLHHAATSLNGLAGDLRPLADALAQQWHGLLPGVHRLRLADERVQLTLAVCDNPQQLLPELSGAHDSLLLRNAASWSLPALKTVTRLLRQGARTAIEVSAHAADVDSLLRELTTCGFEQLPAASGKVLPHRVIQARYAPHWQPRRRLAPDDAPATVTAPGHCAVIGAGLAGASVAYSLAARGWQVTVLDRADAPATGASGLPAGVVAPHVSPDDRPVSRLTRAGTAATLARAAALLTEGQAWASSGVLERHVPGRRRLPPEGQGDLANEATRAASAPASHAQAAQANVPLNAEHPALWHAHAGWIKPAALVRAMLAAPGITWRGKAAATRVQPAFQPQGAAWQVLDDTGTPLVEADIVFITAGFDSLALLQGHQASSLPLHALRGQLAFGPMPEATHALPSAIEVPGHLLPQRKENGTHLTASRPPPQVAASDLLACGHAPANAQGHDTTTSDATAGAATNVLPPFPINGHGSLIAHLPGNAYDTHALNGCWWVAGSTFERGNTRPELLPADHASNHQRLTELLPTAGALLAPQWADDRARAWAAVRATLPDRLPAVGTWPSRPSAPRAATDTPSPAPLPLHLLTGLGARGLTLAVLCGDIAAAWLHDEPLPVAQSLARHLLAGRWLAR